VSEHGNEPSDFHKRLGTFQSAEPLLVSQTELSFTVSAVKLTIASNIVT
jgi:hypothetical protein